MGYLWRDKSFGCNVYQSYHSSPMIIVSSEQPIKESAVRTAYLSWIVRWDTRVVLLSGRTSTDKLKRVRSSCFCGDARVSNMSQWEWEKRILSAIFVIWFKLVVNAYVELMEQPAVSFSQEMDCSLVYVLQDTSSRPSTFGISAPRCAVPMGVWSIPKIEDLHVTRMCRDAKMDVISPRRIAAWHSHWYRTGCESNCNDQFCWCLRVWTRDGDVVYCCKAGVVKQQIRSTLIDSDSAVGAWTAWDAHLCALFRIGR